ncbi:MAG: bifunctional 2-C-methyl-D-erythritol 4-phosphate cytidylyltransferase/2-C-methyl-D-erythritol 2,4-cyclodiphosphate synthase [Ahrensia sp.]
MALVIVAAGRGERAGAGDGPKQYRQLGDRAVIAHTLAAFTPHVLPSRTVIVIHSDDHDLLEQTVPAAHTHYIVVEGGATRQASVHAGLKALEASAPHYVMVHDAARPIVDASMIARLSKALETANAVIPVLPVAETVKRVAADGTILNSIARDELGLAQTPQAFAYTALLDVHCRATSASQAAFTDDASLFEWDGQPVATVAGAPDNIKITYPQDFTKALQSMKTSQSQSAIPDIRAGHGYDVHVFGDGDHVTLCGVEIPHTRRLSGHSDADVCLHALTDALLATCGQGDIGDHFPPSDMQWKGAESHIFLTEALRIVTENGGIVLNADVTIIAEEPKIGPHKEAMRQRLGALLGISPARCSVKATTNEKVGFLGRGEGIAAIATASVYYGTMELSHE